MGSGGGIIPACKLASRVFCVTAAQKASLKGECGQPHSLFQEKVGRAPRGEIRSLGGGDAPIFRLPYFGSANANLSFLFGVGLRAVDRKVSETARGGDFCK